MVWSGFAPDGGVLHGGREATLMALSHALFRLGGIVVSAPRAKDLLPGRDVRMLARQTGRDVARVARRQLLGADAEGRQEVRARA